MNETRNVKNTRMTCTKPFDYSLYILIFIWDAAQSTKAICRINFERLLKQINLWLMHTSVLETVDNVPSADIYGEKDVFEHIKVLKLKYYSIFYLFRPEMCGNCFWIVGGKGRFDPFYGILRFEQHYLPATCGQAVNFGRSYSREAVL